MKNKALVAVDNLTLDNNFTDMTTADLLISQWIKECDVQPLTAKSYNAALNVFVQYLQKKDAVLSEGTLIDYREWLKINRSTSSAKLYFGLTKKFVAWLFKRGYIACNFGDGIKGVKLDTSVHARDALTLDESVEVLKSFNNASREIELRNKTIMFLLINCGLRTCEVTRANVGDVEKRRGAWTMKIWGKCRDGKNDSIILPDEIKTILDDYLSIRSKKYGKLQPNSPLFTSTSNRNLGQRIQTQSVSRLAKRAFQHVGIESPRIVAHSCRHSFATLALQFGVSLDDVSKNLRHLSISTTEIYRHDQNFFANMATRVVAQHIFELLKGVKKIGKN